jgi:predicted phosphodiesterase
MDIQVFSDIHLEFHKDFPKIERKADVLFLAGDIGKINHKNYEEFIQYVNDTWEQTYYVLGNHEFYHSKKTHIRLLVDYQELFEKFVNVTLVLPGQEYYYKGFRIIGSTLWSYAHDKYTNCFKKIRMNHPTSHRKCPITLEYHNTLYENHLEFLKTNIKNKTIVLTHYPVIQYGTSHPKFENQNQQVKDMFANNIVNELDVEYCVFIAGHTHYSYDFEYNGNRFISNQFGYPDEFRETGICERGVFSLDIKHMYAK